MVVVLLAAVLAGVMTTLVGMGGGMTFTACLFAFMEPVEALALGGVALLVGWLSLGWAGTGLRGSGVAEGPV